MQHLNQKKSYSSSKRLKLGSLAAVGGRISNAASQLLITGMLARTLEPSAFGLWAVLYTIYNLVPSLDLGLGQALRLKLAELNARGGEEKFEQRLFSSVLATLIVWGLVLAGIAAVIVNLIPGWDSSLKTALMFFALICGLSTALNLGTQVFYAYEEGFERGIADVVQAIILVIAVWSISGSAHLETVMYTFFAVATLVGVGIVAWFIQRRGWAIKLPRVPDIITAVQLLWRSSIWFWLLGMFAVGIFNTSPLFVAGLTDLEQVGHFSILQRLFTMLVTLHLAWLAPLQSAYTRAAALGEWNWIRATWLRSSSLTLLMMGVASTVLVVIHRDLVLLWTGKNLYEPVLVFIFSVWACGWAWVNVNSVVLNGINVLRPQVTLLGTGFFLYVGAGVFLTPSVGVSGVLIAALIGILPLGVLSQYWIKNRILRQK
jgi:O-antigen/teichoic acid export membrane protein